GSRGRYWPRPTKRARHSLAISQASRATCSAPCCTRPTRRMARGSRRRRPTPFAPACASSPRPSPHRSGATQSAAQATTSQAIEREASDSARIAEGSASQESSGVALPHASRPPDPPIPAAQARGQVGKRSSCRVRYPPLRTEKAMDDVGVFQIDCEVAPVSTPDRRASVAGVYVDSGAELTWLPGEILD